MESNTFVEPGESKLVNVFGDATATDLQKTSSDFKIIINGPVEQIEKEEVPATKGKDKSKSKKNVHKVPFARFVTNKDNEYSLTSERKLASSILYLTLGI